MSAHTKQVLVLLSAGGVGMFLPQLVPLLEPISGTWWWPMTVGSLMLVSLIGALWIHRSSKRSPMQFVAAVNGTTALKLFTAIGWIVAFLVNNEEGRYEYAFGTFGVFVVFTVVLVWGALRQTTTGKKN